MLVIGLSKAAGFLPEAVFPDQFLWCRCLRRPKNSWRLPLSDKASSVHSRLSCLRGERHSGERNGDGQHARARTRVISLSQRSPILYGF